MISPTALVACGCLAVAEIVLPGGDFESAVFENGWSIPRGWSLKDGFGRKSSRALVRERESDGSGGSATVNVAVEPGMAYRIGVWVKAEVRKGKPVDVEMSWRDASGARLGVCSAKPVVNNDVSTEGWTWYEGETPPMPGNVGKTGKFVCFVREATKGEVRFDEATVEPLGVKWIDYLVSSAYQDTIDDCDGNVRFVASLHVNTVRYRLSDIKPILEYVSADGEKATASPLTFCPELVEFMLNSSHIAEGRQDVVLKLLKGSEVLAQHSLSIRKEKRPLRRHVEIDGSGRTLLDGKRFFPLGMYLARLSDELLQTYCEGPFNFAVQYGEISKEDLDRFSRRNIYVAADVRQFVYGYNHSVKCPYSTKDESRAAIRKLVSDIGSHPALMAWYLVDEAPRKIIGNIVEANHYFHELDIDHPTYAVTDKPADVRSLLPCLDAIGMDPYPVGNFWGRAEDFSMCYEWAAKAKSDTFGLRAVWHVPQAFDWEWYRKGRKTDIRTRMPSKSEMANMNWQGIAAGANGLCLYGYHSLYRNLKGEAFRSVWKDVCEAASEVKSMESVLLSDGLTIKMPERNDVAVRAWTRKDGDWYLIVNCNAKAATGMVVLSRRYQSLFEALGGGARLLSDGDRIRYDLPPLGYVFVKLVHKCWWHLW